jgi:hypothetical protein
MSGRKRKQNRDDDGDFAPSVAKRTANNTKPRAVAKTAAKPATTSASKAAAKTGGKGKATPMKEPTMKKESKFFFYIVLATLFFVKRYAFSGIGLHCPASLILGTNSLPLSVWLRTGVYILSHSQPLGNNDYS